MKIATYNVNSIGARLPVLLTLPMVVFILPPLFIVLIGPAILKLIDQLSRVS